MSTVNNIGWCKPYITNDEEWVFVVNEGSIISAFRNDVDNHVSFGLIRDLADHYSGCYHKTSLNDNITILLNECKEISCESCPAYFECECWN